jgi:hypothetical protein
MLADKLKSSGRELIFCGAPSQPEKMMRRAEFARHVSAENICANVEAALDRAEIVYAASASGAKNGM